MVKSASAAVKIDDGAFSGGEKPQLPVGDNRAVEEHVSSDSDDSFTGEPIMPDSQPVETPTRKNFVKKRNHVVLSSDDEDEEPPERVQKSLPDLETEVCEFIWALSLTVPFSRL